jgi:DNA-binding MarR family transcriptional regulator
VDAVAFSRAVTRLFRSGRWRGTKARADRRRSVLQVSAAGAAVYGRIAPLALQYEQALIEVLTPAERATLDRVLARLTERAGELAREFESRSV